MGVDDLVDVLGDNVITTTIGKVIGWGRGNSVWPAQFGLACCAIEMIATATAGVDIARFGSEAMRASPRQADLMIVSGRVSQKMAPILRMVDPLHYVRGEDGKETIEGVVQFKGGWKFNPADDNNEDVIPEKKKKDLDGLEYKNE